MSGETLSPETLSPFEEEVQFHKNKPWTVVITKDPESSQYVVMLPDFEEGLIAGDRVEAASAVEGYLDDTIRKSLELGIAIPEVKERQPEEFFPHAADSSFDA